MTKARMRSRLGDNPLDALIPTKATAAAPRTRRPSVQRPEGGVVGRSAKQTFNVDPDLLEEMRAAVVTCAGPPLRLTMASLLDRALRAELARLRKQMNDGRPFEPVGAPRRGRPLNV